MVKIHGQLFWRCISKNKISIWLHSDICFFFFECNLPFNLEHLKTLQKGVASQRHSPKTRKLRSVFSHPQVVRDILRRCLEPTMAMIRDLVQIENLGSKRRQTGMVRSAKKRVLSSYDKKTLYNNEWVCNLWESWFLLILSVVGVGYSQLVMFFDYQETICCTVLVIKTQGTRIKTCLFRKIFSCFCACLVKKWEIPPISEVSKKSFPPRLSPRRRFSFPLFSCWLSCPKHQGWLTSTRVILTFFKLEPFQALRIKTFEPSFSEGKFGGMFLVNFGRKNQQIKLH